MTRRTKSHLAEADFLRAIPGAVRQRLCRGEVRSGADVLALRRFVGMSQDELACAMGISVATLQNWGDGRRRPKGAAVALIRIAARVRGSSGACCRHRWEGRAPREGV